MAFLSHVAIEILSHRELCDTVNQFKYLEAARLVDSHPGEGTPETISND
jgi:hypothetical protein